MQRDIKVKWFFRQSPEKVWHCLTDPDMLSLWLMKTDFKLELGYKFNFFTRPIPQMGFDGIVYCEVLEIVPLKKLVYSWKGGPRPGVIKLDTLLVWSLQPCEGGTELLLEHKGFKGFGNMMASIFMGNGWKKHIPRRFEKVLDNYVHGRPVSEGVTVNC